MSKIAHEVEQVNEQLQVIRFAIADEIRIQLKKSLAKLTTDPSFAFESNGRKGTDSMQTERNDEPICPKLVKKNVKVGT